MCMSIGYPLAANCGLQLACKLTRLCNSGHIQTESCLTDRCIVANDIREKDHYL